MEGAGARRRGGGEQLHRSRRGQPQWLEWSALEGLPTEARLSQLCRWVLKSEAGHPHAYGLRIPGTEIAPGEGCRASHPVPPRPGRLFGGAAMKLAAAAAAPVSYAQFKWICACLALALLPHLAALPLWLLLAVCVRRSHSPGAGRARPPCSAARAPVEHHRRRRCAGVLAISYF